MRDELFSRAVLLAARCLPRGGFPLVRRAARFSPLLRDYPLELTLVPGQTVRADLRESVWYALWKHGCYPEQLPEDTIAMRVLRPGDVVWDVGANIGYNALVFSHAVGSTGRVECFEPSRRSFIHLERTIASRAGVSAHNLAIADVTGTVLFRDAESLNVSSLAGDDEAGSYEVTAQTLDSWLAGSGNRAPTFLKVDVEGHEAKVFAGGQSLIRDHRPIVQFEAISIEAKRELPEQLSQYANQAYRYFAFSPGSKLIPLDVADLSTCTNNFLAVADQHLGRLDGLVES